MSRPPVTVVLPFWGSAAEAREALARLASIELRDGDAALLVDNTADGVAAEAEPPAGVRVVRSPVTASAYAARNVGVEHAETEWILFIDADCRPRADLLDRYWDPPPGERAGLVAGGVTGTPGQGGIVPAYARSRGHLDQALLAHHPYRPMAVTANLLVRRAAWEAVGGFLERTRSGADADFCWRVVDAGWEMELREGAAVTHDHRATLRALLAQTRRDGAGGRWLAGRWEGYRPAFGARDFLRAAAGAVLWPLLGQPRRGLFKAIDGIWGAAFDLGMLQSNGTPQPPAPPAEVVVVAEAFPRPDDPLVGALADAAARGQAVVVEAARQPRRPDWARARAIPAAVWEDDGPWARAVAAARLLPRRAPSLEHAPAALRLRAAAPGARVLAEPALAPLASRLSRAAGRADLRVEPVADVAAALAEAAEVAAGAR